MFDETPTTSVKIRRTQEPSTDAVDEVLAKVRAEEGPDRKAQEIRQMASHIAAGLSHKYFVYNKLRVAQQSVELAEEIYRITEARSLFEKDSTGT